MYVCIYVCIYVCMYVCMYAEPLSTLLTLRIIKFEFKTICCKFSGQNTVPQIFDIYIYIYIYVCVCVRVYVCMYVCMYAEPVDHTDNQV